MGGKTRKMGIDILSDVPWGTHFCQFYQTKEDLIDILVPYFKAGLENNEFCMWITSEPLSEKEAKKAMREALPDFDRYLKRGQIEIIPHEEWYLEKGSFNIQRVLSGWIDKLDQALAQGYDGLRLTGNTFWLEERDWRNFTEYEEKVNNVIGKYKMMAICSYSLDKCGASEVIDVVSNHQFALIRKEVKWELIESSDLKQAEEEIERVLHRLKERYAELSCLYEIDKISRKEGVTIEESLKEVAQLMPPAWQYPEITGSCITYEDKKYKTRKFKETKWMQRANIIVSNKKAGLVEVCYLEKKPKIDEGPFVEEERNLINAISERLGQTIERKRAEEEIKSSREQLRNLAAHLQSVREEERKLIAREIHDELGQSLTALKMDLYWLDKRMPIDQRPLLKKTKSMSRLIDKTIRRIKKISAELRPGLLDYLGLPAAIEWEGKELQNRTEIKCEVNIDSEDIILEQDHSTAFFRIFQEVLTNAARHAKATRIKVSLKEKAGKLELRVRDNGKGITEKQISDPKSFGLIGMRERAQFLGGEVKIRGVQDKGTTIIATIPLPKIGKA